MAEVLGVAASALAVTEIGAKIARLCTQYLRDVSNAKKDVERVQQEVSNLCVIAAHVQRLLEGPHKRQLVTTGKLNSALKTSHLRLNGLERDLIPGKSKATMSKFGLRALKWPFHSKETQKIILDLAGFAQTIGAALQVDQMNIILQMNQHMVLAKLPIAEGATFDSHAEEHNPCCQANTRVDLLRDINTWSADPTTKAIYWLNGMAGTGKSTIARSLAHMFSENSTLGATFFFKRGESDRTKITKFFSTMASQLIKRLPEIAVHVEIALNADPAIFTKTMREQFRKLIMDPLSKISDTTFVNRTVMIIVDALDECEREEDVKLIIDLISYSRTLQSPRLKVFLTSRPELPIRLGFEAINSIYQGFNLHEIASPVIEHDITTFLKHELDRVRYEYNRNVNVDRQISANWPNPSDIQKLVKMSFPLFISAATVCRFIADRKGGNPERKLWRVLAYQELQSSRLYATYMPVLEQLIVDTSPINREEMLQQFQEVVGSIILLENPLSTSALARLLEIALENILDILDLLHSVLRVPSSFEEPVKLLHLSFRDFLVDSERQKSSFWVDKKDVHQRLATKCLRIMQKSLRADVCGVQNPGTLQSSMTLERVNKSLTSETQYACKFWSHHLKEANASITDCDEVWEFLSSHFLHWLEALSWLGRASESLEVIRTIQSLLHPDAGEKISNFLNDAFRFIVASSSILQAAPLQIYWSALVFA